MLLLFCYRCNFRALPMTGMAAATLRPRVLHTLLHLQLSLLMHSSPPTKANSCAIKSAGMITSPTPVAAAASDPAPKQSVLYLVLFYWCTFYWYAHSTRINSSCCSTCFWGRCVPSSALRLPYLPLAQGHLQLLHL